MEAYKLWKETRNYEIKQEEMKKELWKKRSVIVEKYNHWNEKPI